MGIGEWATRAVGFRTPLTAKINQITGWLPSGGMSPITAACDQCAGVGCPACAWPVNLPHGGWHMAGPGAFQLPYPLPDDKWWVGGGMGGGLVPAITRATAVLVNPIVRTPWVLERNGEPLPLPGWLTDPMRAASVPGRNPEGLSLAPAARRLTAHDFHSTLLTQAVWYGRAVLLYQEQDREDGGEPQPVTGSLRIVNPFMLEVDDAGRYVLWRDDPAELVFDAEGRVRMSNGVAYRLRVLRGLPPHDGDDLMGGALTRHQQVFGIGLHIQSYQDGVFTSGTPAGVLKVSAPNMTPDEAQALKASWMAAHGGDKRGIAVLGSTVDFSPVTWSPVDTDLDKSKRINLMDIAHAFGISSAWLDVGGDSLTYANMSDRRRDLVDHSLTEWAASLMELYSSILPYGQRLTVDWSQYTTPTGGPGE